MSAHFAHYATITVSVPAEAGFDAQVAALRAAGVPVDGTGKPETGLLFRRDGLGRRRLTTYRWFAQPLNNRPTDRPAAFAHGDPA